MNDDFFVGYQPRQPSRMATFTAAVSGTLILLAIGLAVLLSASQDEPATAAFEFGVTTGYTGVVRLDPYPRLELSDGSTVLLVAPFKHGADEMLKLHVGAGISLRGSLIHRQGLRMVEIEPGSVERISPDADISRQPVASSDPVAAPQTESAPLTVRGEILDAKCYLGVMKPGRGTVHRACARLCLRGGIPALLSFVDAHGGRHIALITTGGADPIPDDFLRWVARPVELTGSYAPDAAGGIGVFNVETQSIRLL